MNEELWIYNDFSNNGFTISHLCQKYGKDLSEILKIVVGEPPANFPTHVHSVTLHVKGELIQKIVERIGEDVDIKGSIELMILDYLTNIPHAL